MLKRTFYIASLFLILLGLAWFFFLPWACVAPSGQIPVPPTETQKPAESYQAYCQFFEALPLTIGQTLGDWAAWFFDKENSNIIIAVSTVFIALFTLVLGVSTLKLWSATNAALELARDEFNATHRPRVIVRFIQGPLLNEDDFQTAWITIINKGDTPATVFAMGADLACRNRKTHHWSPSLDGSAKPIPPLILESGKPHTFPAVLEGKGTPLEYILEESDLCVVGQVLYRDKNGRERQTGIFRVYDPDSKSFIPSQHEDEEYQD